MSIYEKNQGNAKTYRFYGMCCVDKKERTQGFRPHKSFPSYVITICYYACFMTMAFTGQRASQMPQPTHFSGSITAFLFTILTASQ